MIINDLYNNKKFVAEAIGDLGSKRDIGKSVRKWRKSRGLDEQGGAEDPNGYNVVRYYKKTQEVKKLTNWLEKEAGLPRNSSLYFDDVDLVYGNKTIVPGALINPKLTFNDLLTAVVQASKQGIAEATGDEKFDTMMGQIQREPKYPDSQMPPTDVKDLYQWAVKNNKPYHKIFAKWANREGYKSVAQALERAGNLDTDALDYWTPRVWEIYWGEVRGIDSEMPPEWAKKRIPDELRDYLDTVFDAYDRIVFDWPTEYRQIGQQGMAEGYVPINISKMPTDPAPEPKKVEPKHKYVDNRADWEQHYQARANKLYNVVGKFDRKVLNPEPIKGLTAAEEFMKQNGLSHANADLVQVSTLRFHATGIDASGKRVVSEPLLSMKDVRNFYKQHGINPVASTTDLTTTDEGSVTEGNSGPVTHRIGLTVTDPNHPMVSKRGETIQKTVRVKGDSREKAINSAIAHYRRKGYKVHDHHYIGTVDEGRFVRGPGGVPLDRQGRPVAPKAPKAEPMRMRQWVVHHEGQRGEGGEMTIDAPNFETAWELANEYDLDIIDIKPVKGVAEGLSEMDKSQTPPGRDGSNDEGGKKEYPAKIITPKKAVKDGVKILNKVLNKKQGVAEVTLGDYPKKAAVNKAVAQANRFFDRDDPAAVAAADQTIAKRERGLARADARVKPYTPPVHDAEKHQRDLTAKYPNIDELVAQAEKRRDPYYDRAEGNAYYAGREAEHDYQKLRQIQRVIQGLNEHKERQNNMRTKEITESQLDEISLDQIGTGIANVLGGVSKTVGAVAGVPQGIGRAVKKGYRGAVKGIGGAADDGSNPASDVPGAAYGDTSRGKELPTGTGEINPATGRAYVPSDFANQSTTTVPVSAGDTGKSNAGNSPADIQKQIRTVERNYQTQMADLTAKLKTAQSQSSATGPELSQQQQDYISAIGTDQPSIGGTSAATDNAASAVSTPAAAPGMARDPKVLSTLQSMNAKELQIIKKILQARARGVSESQLDEVAFGDVWRGTGDRLKNATSGIRSAAASAADMAKSAYKTAKPYVKKAGQFAAAVPGAVATGAGAVAGGVTGMKNAARKGYAAGQKHVGGGALTMDELQQAIGGMTADDAKQLLMFVKQLEIQNAPAKGKAKPKARKPSATTLPSNTTPTTTTPTWTGRQTATEPTAVAESLTWSKKFDPGMTVYKRMKSGR